MRIIELTARQKARLMDGLIQESTTEELEVLACKLIREYAKFQGADMTKIQQQVSRLIKTNKASDELQGQHPLSDF